MHTQQRVAVTLAPLGEPQESLAWISAQGARGVQLSAAQPGLRPRELDGSARRDLRAVFRRLELECSGIDAFVPPDQFTDGVTSERAIDAVRHSCALASEMGRVPVCVSLPAPSTEAAKEARRQDAIAALVSAASSHGVLLANIADNSAPWPPIGVCIDPAAALASKREPDAVVLASAGRIVAARIVDLLKSGTRGPIGHPEGQLECLDYRISLESAGFSGLPVIDARGWADPRAGAVRSLAAWRDAIAGAG